MQLTPITISLLFSLGKVYVIPESKMGIALPNYSISNASSSEAPDQNNLAVRFRIKSGDPEGFFKAESERVSEKIQLKIYSASRFRVTIAISYL